MFVVRPLVCDDLVLHQKSLVFISCRIVFRRWAKRIRTTSRAITPLHAQLCNHDQPSKTSVGISWVWVGFGFGGWGRCAELENERFLHNRPRGIRPLNYSRFTARNAKIVALQVLITQEYNDTYVPI